MESSSTHDRQAFKQSLQDRAMTYIYPKSPIEVSTITNQFPFNVWSVFPRELGEQIFEYVISDIGEINLLGMRGEKQFFGKFAGMPELFDKSSPVREFAIAAVLRTNIVQSSSGFRIGHIATKATINKLKISHHVRRLKLMDDFHDMHERDRKAIANLISSLPNLEQVEYRSCIQTLSYRLDFSTAPAGDTEECTAWPETHFLEIVVHPRIRRVVVYDEAYAKVSNDVIQAKFVKAWRRLQENWEGLFEPQARRIELMWRK